MTEFTQLPDLAARRFGGSVVLATDEFFAAKENLIRDEPAVFTPRTYGARGQTYDGWETRRHRDDATADDHAIVRLGMPGTVRGVVIDTSHFTGNYPPEASVDGCAALGYPSPDELHDWFPLVPRTAVQGDHANAFDVAAQERVTHVRLSLHPDGGVARLRVHGEPVPDPALLRGGVLDLAALENGGDVVEASDDFYGSPQNILAPGVPRSAGDGWETRRRREGGNDWVVLRLGVPGIVRVVEIDTTCFIGNAPASAALTGAANGEVWSELLPLTRLQPDTRHRFAIIAGPVVSRVRLDIIPDGGLGRLRLWGVPAPAPAPSG